VKQIAACRPLGGYWNRVIYESRACRAVFLTDDFCRACRSVFLTDDFCGCPGARPNLKTRVPSSIVRTRALPQSLQSRALAQSFLHQASSINAFPLSSPLCTQPLLNTYYHAIINCCRLLPKTPLTNPRALPQSQI
jgi:hypothetical protein